MSPFSKVDSRMKTFYTYLSEDILWFFGNILKV